MTSWASGPSDAHQNSNVAVSDAGSCSCLKGLHLALNPGQHVCVGPIQSGPGVLLLGFPVLFFHSPQQCAQLRRSLEHSQDLQQRLKHLRHHHHNRLCVVQLNAILITARICSTLQSVAFPEVWPAYVTYSAQGWIWCTALAFTGSLCTVQSTVQRSDANQRTVRNGKPRQIVTLCLSTCSMAVLTVSTP